jgi:hypothetical protein
MNEDEFGVSMKMTEILERLIMEKGLELPFLATAVWINGSCMFLKFSQAQAGLKAKLITGHIKDKGIGLPINMMLVYAKGKASNIIIQKSPDKYEFSKLIGHA